MSGMSRSGRQWLWTRPAPRLLQIPASTAQQDTEQSWGSTGCHAEQRRTHVPSTLSSSARAKQGNHLQNAANGRPQRRACSAPYCPEMCVVLGSFMQSGQSGYKLGCCSPVPEQISRLSSSKTPRGHFKTQHRRAANNVGSM